MLSPIRASRQPSFSSFCFGSLGKFLSFFLFSVVSLSKMLMVVVRTCPDLFVPSISLSPGRHFSLAASYKTKKGGWPFCCCCCCYLLGQGFSY